MSSSSGLLSLPTELQLQIAIHLLGDGKRTNKSDLTVKSLLNTALTCQHLASVAREALCTTPILYSSKTPTLLAFLLKYPSLPPKIKHLTIETPETHKQNTFPIPIPHLAPHTLTKCKRHIRHLPIPKPLRDQLTALLKAPRFETHATPLALLLTMLPHLQRLYLGGSILLNYPFFVPIMPNSPDATHSAKPDWAPGPDMSWVLSLIGPRLTHLELPVDLRRSAEANAWTPLSIVGLPAWFPRLEWLSIPHMAATEISKTSARDVVSPLLRTLVLTDARCDCFEQFAGGLVGEEGRVFPRLERVELYHRYPGPGTDGGVVGRLGGVGIEVCEFEPECCLRSGDEFYHPWKYAPGEIRGLETSRHWGYGTEWERAVLQCGSDEE